MDTLRIISLKMSELCAQAQLPPCSPFSCGADQNKVTIISSFNERNVPFSFLFSGKQVSWFCSNVQHFNEDPFEITLEKCRPNRFKFQTVPGNGRSESKNLSDNVSAPVRILHGDNKVLQNQLVTSCVEVKETKEKKWLKFTVLE